MNKSKENQLLYDNNRDQYSSYLFAFNRMIDKRTQNEIKKQDFQTSITAALGRVHVMEKKKLRFYLK